MEGNKWTYVEGHESPIGFVAAKTDRTVLFFLLVVIVFDAVMAVEETVFRIGFVDRRRRYAAFISGVNCIDHTSAGLLIERESLRTKFRGLQTLATLNVSSTILKIKPKTLKF